MTPATFDPGPLAEVEYRADGDRWTLVFVRTLHHPPEQVWEVGPIRGQDAMNYGWQELHDAYAERLKPS